MTLNHVVKRCKDGTLQYGQMLMGRTSLETVFEWVRTPSTSLSIRFPLLLTSTFLSKVTDELLTMDNTTIKGFSDGSVFTGVWTNWCFRSMRHVLLYPGRI